MTKQSNSLEVNPRKPGDGENQDRQARGIGAAACTARVAALLKTGGRSRALTIVRTELGRAYSLAGQQRMEQASEVLPGLRKQWRRSGKLRARLTHDAIDGQLRDADKPAGARRRDRQLRLPVASLDGELGGQASQAQGVLGGGDRAQPDSRRVVKLRGC